MCICFVGFGPPSVTLKCLVDYVKLNKTIEVSWKPTLLSSATHLSTENINEPAQAYIKCKGGYNHTVRTARLYTKTTLRYVFINMCTILLIYSMNLLHTMKLEIYI